MNGCIVPSMKCISDVLHIIIIVRSEAKEVWERCVYNIKALYTYFKNMIYITFVVAFAFVVLRRTIV